MEIKPIIVKKEYFLFDFDDTMVDTHEYNKNVVFMTLLHYKPDLSIMELELFFKEHNKLTIHDIYQLAIDRFNLNVPILDLLEKDKLEQIKNASKVKPLNGVIELLENLHSMHKNLYIYSNRRMSTLMPMLKSLSFVDYFIDIVSCVDVGKKKPDTSCLECLNIGNHNRHKYIYIGDSHIDVEFAQNANIDYILIDKNSTNPFDHILSALKA